MKHKHVDLNKFVTEVTYKVCDYLKIQILQLDPGRWGVFADSVGGLQSFRHMAARKTFGGLEYPAPTFQAAEEQAKEIARYMYAPLTTKEIRAHFNEKWIRREEQAKELHLFKHALLDRNWIKAATLLNKSLSNYTKEAIPAKVFIQVSINLPEDYKITED
jgi:hypothetical protein